ncbi:ABC transporter substrate-binding protein [Vibrio anguillarum]|uniref:ABC transporter substrate-binding protein n=1 Tax=Vibrio anguillarum TaxID=55601 RepID=UPI00097E2254|nr:ABC transporter substrate-binding protein [Vibrio anguillarum]ASG00068.1 ABC transporter substrate-binding protein [Vibrio anguillarum]MBT2947427.1 ABC transporter substrate-binding protein [Vibrio anguillarum]
MAMVTKKHKAQTFHKVAVAIVVLVVTIAIFNRQLGHFYDASRVEERKAVRIAVSQTPLSSSFIIADSLGFFEQQGVNVELVPCSGGVACSQALFSGNVDYATASESVVMFKLFQRNDFALLTSFVESDNDLKLLTLERLGMVNLSDLEGKKVGIVKASASEFYFDSLLIASDLKEMAVEKVYLPPEALNDSLFSSQVDAISVWEPYGYKTETSAPSDVLNLGLSGIYHLSFNLLSMKATVEEAHDEIVAILRALKEANEWINLNPEQSREVIAQALNIPLPQLEWSWNDYVFRLSLGNALLSNLQLQARWAIEAGMVTGDKPDFRTVLASKPIEEVLRTKVSIK